MDRSFDLLALLKERPVTKTHKVKPTQFMSVAGGVQKRLETNIKHRKSSRLSVFDRIRNISKCESPCRPVLTAVQQKAEHRKQQLEKWKEEKEKKKKEAAAQKKKPFVAGVAHKTTFGPPPPSRPMPSTSGRVTRSQALRQRHEQARQTQSFAPNNAAFKPPQFNASQMPTLAPISKRKTNKTNFTFEPILPQTSNKVESTRAARSKSVATKLTTTTETKVTRRQNDRTKPQPKNIVSKPPLKQNMFQSSSSSDMEQPIKTKPQPKNIVSKPPLKQNMLLSSSSSDMEQSMTKPLKSLVSMPPLKQNMFQSSSSSDMDQPIQKSLETKTYKRQSSSSSDTKHMKEPLLPEKTSMYQSSSSSDIDQSLPKPSMYQSSSSSDYDQQISKLQDTSSTSQESISEKEIVETHTPQNEIPKSESSSEEKLRPPKSSELQLTPEQIIQEAENSPYVTLSRGKANARKEMKKKLEEGLLDEDNSNIESVAHFRRQLESEITRISSMCEAWDKIFAQTVLPEPIQELVLTAVGQARLLVSQKMQQFAGLVEACAARAPGAALVTPADLHGFWDMLFMQVENVDMRFRKLEELRACGWAEEPAAPAASRPAGRPASRPAASRPAARQARPAGGPSRLRDLIAAARKAKKQQESQPSESSDSEQSEPTADCKTFEAGFFSVSSPVRQPGASAPATPANKSSLLKAVLSSEARKASATKNSTSFAMLRASLMSKNVDIEGISPLMQTPKLTPLNLYATPARSILKQANPLSAKKSEKLKTVLFHESDEDLPGSSPGSSASCRDKPGREAPAALETAEEAAGAAAGKENQPTPRRRSRLSRQSAVECSSPVMTRSRRKSALTPAPASASAPAPAKGGETPRRSARRRKSAAVV